MQKRSSTLALFVALLLASFAQAQETWSLSRLTLPHALVRVLFIEQLYRAVTLIDGHPYHRE